MKIKFVKPSAFLVGLLLSISINGACAQDQLPKVTERDYQQWLESAEEGDAKAQYRLSLLYRDGIIVEQNDALAFEWVSKSAKAGNASAQTDVGTYYATGKGVERDLETASSYYQLAADQGYPRGVMNLANSYLMGRGVNRDSEKGVALFTQAAQKGYAPAQSTLGTIYQHGVGAEKDYEKSFIWLTKAHEQGYASGTYGLAGLHANGYGMKKDTAKAFSLYQQGANQGHLGSMYNLGVSYRDGIAPSEKNLEKAVLWFSKAAEAGHASSQYAFGLMLAKGQGVAESTEKAMMLIANSAKQGYTPAVELLTKLNDEGSDDSDEVQNAPTEQPTAEDALAELWAYKELIIAYFDTCSAQVPQAFSEILALRKKWEKKNRKTNAKIDKYMLNYLEMNKDSFEPGQTVDSGLTELRANIVDGVEKDFVETPEEMLITCKNLEQPLGEITENYLALYKQNKKQIKKAYK